MGMILVFIIVPILLFREIDKQQQVDETILKARMADEEFRKRLRTEGKTLLYKWRGLHTTRRTRRFDRG